MYLSRMINFLNDPNMSDNLRSVLKLLTALYGAFNLEKHVSVLVQGGYFHDNNIAPLHAAVEELCLRLKPEAVALVDAIAPPDFVLNSALGHSDGQVYHHLEKQMMPGMKRRPPWWRLVLEPVSKSHL